MKKNLTIGLILVLIISGILMGFQNKVYALNSASISPSSKTVEVGDTVTITVNFGQKVSAATFSMTGATGNLTYKGASVGEYTPSTGRFGFFGNNDDWSSVALTFTANKAGTANVALSNVKVSSGEEVNTPIGLASSSSKITVNEKVIPTPTPTPNPTEVPSTPTPNKPSNNNDNNDNNQTTPTPTPKNENPEENKQDENNEENKNDEDDKQEENNEENNEQNNETAPNKIIKIDDTDIITVKNEENNVMVKALPIAIKEENVILDVKLIEENSNRMTTISDIMKNIKGNKKYYDIKLLKDDTAIQPNGYVTVYLPIPQEYNRDKLELYYINEETNKSEKIKGEVQGDYYTFTTNHFSVYSLVEREIEENQKGESISISNIIFLVLAVILVVAIVIIFIKRNKKEEDI